MTHPAREAICRCPQCHHYFCRECVTEHNAQFICSQCLRRVLALERAGEARRRGFRWWMMVPAAGSAALLVAWFFFYTVGQIVLSLTATGGGR